MYANPRWWCFDLVKPNPEEERTEGVPKPKAKPFCKVAPDHHGDGVDGDDGDDDGDGHDDEDGDADMISVTSSISSASVKYFWIWR